MLTAIFEATLDTVEFHARKYLPDAIVVMRGRLTAVQSARLDQLGERAIREIAEAHNLPLRAVVHKPPFALHQPQLALAPGGSQR